MNCWGSGGMVDGGHVTKVNLFYNGITIMPASRKLDPAKLLSWSRQGLTAEQMKERLKSQSGITASLDLVRLRLREARQEADGR